MSDISIQFHAAHREIHTFVRQMAAEFNLHIVVMRFFPFEVREIAIDELQPSFCDASSFTRLYFSLDQPCISVENELEFEDYNPDSLRLDIGKLASRSLEQSSLGASTENPAAFAIWRRIAKRLKAITLAGVTAINRHTGATGPAHNFRYTSGAKSLESAGVKMVQFTNAGPALRLGMEG